jgi:hypothetical protein
VIGIQSRTTSISLEGYSRRFNGVAAGNIGRLDRAKDEAGEDGRFFIHAWAGRFEGATDDVPGLCGLSTIGRSLIGSPWLRLVHALQSVFSLLCGGRQSRNRVRCFLSTFTTHVSLDTSTANSHHEPSAKEPSLPGELSSN